MAKTQKSLPQLVRNLAFDLLDDDHGISTRAYMNLVEIARIVSDDSLFQDLLCHIEATDGRFYLPKTK